MYRRIIEDPHLVQLGGHQIRSLLKNWGKIVKMVRRILVDPHRV
jgi:hypothetical protein